MKKDRKKRPSKAVPLADRPLKLRELQRQPDGERRRNVAPNEARKREKMYAIRRVAEELRDGSRVSLTALELAKQIAWKYPKIGLSEFTIRKYLLSMFPKRFGCLIRGGPSVMHGGYLSYPDQ